MAEDKSATPTTEPPQMGPGWLEYVRGSVFKYIIVAVLPALAFVIMVLYVNFCLSLLALPLVAVFLIWLFRIKKLWHQIALGAVALTLASMAISAVYMAAFTEVPGGLYSGNGALVNGRVAPYSGTPNTVYVFTVTVEHNATDIDSYVIISDLVGSNELNLTMQLVSHSADYSIRNFSANTTLVNPVSNFRFATNIDGEWHKSNWYNGPISSDSLAVYGTFAGAILLEIFAYCFMQYIVMLLFLRMSAKSKDTREKMLKDYQKKKELTLGRGKDAKESPEEAAEGESKEDTFVCSECGAEVKASAKYCPNCGEPFDDEDEGESGSEHDKK